MINLDDYFDIGTHWIALYAINNNVTYFDSFGVDHIPKEIEKCINRFSITTDIYRTQGYNSVTCKYFCIVFIDFMLRGKRSDFTSLFSPNILEKK